MELKESLCDFCVLCGNLFWLRPEAAICFKGRELGIAVAEAMFEMVKSIRFTTRPGEFKGFSQDQIDRALKAARNRQLKMKLQNMPLPLTPEMVDEYMGPI